MTRPTSALASSERRAGTLPTPALAPSERWS
jgi:hypothetical protein